MSVERTCATCGRTFVAQRKTAKYCSQHCKNQATWDAHQRRQEDEARRERLSPNEARWARRGQIEESLEERLRGVMAGHRGQHARGTTHNSSQPSTPVRAPSGHAGGVEPTDG